MRFAVLLLMAFARSGPKGAWEMLRAAIVDPAPADEHDPWMPPTCPTCDTPYTRSRKFNSGNPKTFWLPDCDCLAEQTAKRMGLADRAPTDEGGA